MKSRELKVNLLRKTLEKSGFYEDIIFADEFVSEKIKNIVTEWIFNLQEFRNIEVKKFRDLFKELDEIVFPIIINESYGSCSLNIEFIDVQGNKYYMSKINLYDYHDMQTYIIGRRNSSLEPLVDREFHYQINEDKTIILIGTCILQLNQDGTNKDAVVNFSYDYDERTTQVTLRSYASSNKIKIKYPTVNAEFDKMVMNYLFESNKSKWYYYDVFPILKWMVMAISDERISISIVAEVEKEIVSEIDVVNGIVQKYTVTKIINEGEMHIIKKLFAKELNKFLAERELI